MSLANELQKIKDDHPDLFTALCEAREVTDLVKEAIKAHVQDWMKDVGIKGNVQVQMNVRASKYREPHVYVEIGYIAIWNNDYASGRWKGWLNKLSFAISSPNYVSGGYYRRIGHSAKTDPAFVGTDILDKFEKKMMDIHEIVWSVFGTPPWLQRRV